MTQRKIKHITLGARIHKFPQTPTDLHRRALLVAQRIDLLPLDEDELVLAVFAVVHAVRGAERDDAEFGAAVCQFGVLGACFEALLCEAGEELLVDLAGEFAGRRAGCGPGGDVEGDEVGEVA